jgi:peptidoglycan/xylan/chitin deacetylase (PgdA/CDA1 family)
VIIQPNQRRRTRVARVGAGTAVVLLVGSLLSTGWIHPTASSIGAPTATLTSSPSPTVQAAAAEPSLAVPAPTAAPPLVDGCAPPPADLEPAEVMSHGSRSAKQVALTFDDGTNPNNVVRILRALTRAHVNATFFPTGRSVERFPETWKRVATAGFPIANHTYNHRALGGRCYDSQVAELLHNERVIADLGFTLLPVMRPPYEDYDDATLSAAAYAGESHVVLWDVDTLDWTGLGRRAIAASALSGRSGSIVLMHTSNPSTAAALPRIIRSYRKRGFTFVTIGQLFGIPGAVPFPSPPTAR